jgi:hypothetical protein
MTQRRAGMKKVRIGQRWKLDRNAAIGYQLSPAHEAIAQLAYYLGARAALQYLAHGDRDKGMLALKKEVRAFLLAAGLHE